MLAKIPAQAQLGRGTLLVTVEPIFPAKAS